MILYLDASTLVKRYISEPGTPEVEKAISSAGVVGTSIISRAEVSAALAKAIRTVTLTREKAASALQVFRSEWPNLVRIQTTEMLIAQADALAWELSLRGYDAVHLASALLLKESMDEEVEMATFDLQLWKASQKRGLIVFLDNLPELMNYSSMN